MGTNTTKIVFLRRDKCILCNGALTDGISGVEDWETRSGIYDIRICKVCKFGFTDPYPSEATAGNLYAAKTSTDFDMGDHPLIRMLKDAAAEKQVSGLLPRKARAEVRRILDYATGNGRYAVALSKLYPRAVVDAVDYQPESPYLLKGSTHERIHYSFIEQFERHDSSEYQVIFLRHVLEHAHDPVQLVGRLVSRLHPDGLMYIEVPNLESGCEKLFRKAWRGFHVPRHICHFTEKSLGTILGSQGLRYSIRQKSIPWMGNQTAIWFHDDPAKLRYQFLGILLSPFQMLIETAYRNSNGLVAIASRSG